MATQQLEKRIAALEVEVTQLKKEIRAITNGTSPWWEQISGSFANDPAFKEAMRLGREYRESLRPAQKKRQKR